MHITTQSSNTFQAKEPLFFVTIHVNQLFGKRLKYTMARDTKVIRLYKLIIKDTEIPPEQIRLSYKNGILVSLFSEHLSEYFEPENEYVHFHLRWGHRHTIAKDYPLIFQQAMADTGLVATVEEDSEVLYQRFRFLYDQAIAAAMNN